MQVMGCQTHAALQVTAQTCQTPALACKAVCNTAFSSCKCPLLSIITAATSSYLLLYSFSRAAQCCLCMFAKSLLNCCSCSTAASCNKCNHPSCSKTQFLKLAAYAACTSRVAVAMAVSQQHRSDEVSLCSWCYCPARFCCEGASGCCQSCIQSHLHFHYT